MSRAGGASAEGAVSGASGATEPASPAPARWDAFVTAAPLGSYLQLSGWARVKAANGWTSTRLLREISGEQIGAQILVRRPRPLPWGFAYAPRGPVASAWSPAAVEAFTVLVRRELALRLGPVSHLRIEPEIERDGPDDPGGSVRSGLRRTGWRPAPPIQPASTRIVDLTTDEDALWGALRRKWRQYVNKARTAGIEVVEGGGDRLPEFYDIYRGTARRAGFPIRTLGAYRDIWEAFAPAGQAKLLFAQTPNGQAHATLFLVRCGPRVVEPYGGMTSVGAESRANYLLKWEAMRRSREAGASSYDMWGMVTPGIARFKEGFGGREVHYIGGWDLVLNEGGRSLYAVAQRMRVWVSRRRRDVDRWRGRLPGAGTEDSAGSGGRAGAGEDE